MHRTTRSDDGGGRSDDGGSHAREGARGGAGGARGRHGNIAPDRKAASFDRSVESGWEWDGEGAAPAKGIVLPGPVQQYLCIFITPFFICLF